MTTTSRIIPKALCVFQHAGRVLVCFSTDAAKGQRYARPPGGTIEFGEHAGEAVEREVQEELGACIADLTLVGVLENIFTLEGEPRHEILFVFTAGFADPSVYATTRVPMREPGWEGDAEWVPLERFVSGDVPLYPTGLLPLLERAHRERL